MLSDAEDPICEDASLGEADEDEAASSNAEPYRTGRRLLIGSGGPTMSAPGRDVKRAERREDLGEGDADALEEEAEAHAVEEETSERRLSRAARLVDAASCKVEGRAARAAGPTKGVIAPIAMMLRLGRTKGDVERKERRRRRVGVDEYG
jgi:hypothetical protein